jgi:octaprenyl-diphosphate synthase
VLAKRDSGDEAAMIEYGQQLGTAFQLIDDALDYDASPDELGKNIGDDLAEGKATLPLIQAMRAGSDAERELIRTAILTGGLEQMDQIQEIIRSTGALDYTVAKAREAADAAIAVLTGLPANDYRQALMSLAEFAIQRRS